MTKREGAQWDILTSYFAIVTYRLPLPGAHPPSDRGGVDLVLRRREDALLISTPLILQSFYPLICWSQLLLSTNPLSSYPLISTPLILLFSGGDALWEGRLRHPLRPRTRQAPGIHTCLKHLLYWSIILDKCRWWRRAWWLLWTSTWTRSTWRWPSWSHSSRTGWVYWPTDHQLVNWHLENLITQPDH